MQKKCGPIQKVVLKSVVNQQKVVLIFVRTTFGKAYNKDITAQSSIIEVSEWRFPSTVFRKALAEPKFKYKSRRTGK